MYRQGEFSRTVISLLNTREAPDQGGLLTGKDPTAVNKSDPLRLWIIQVGIIVGTATLLSLGLRKLRQPKVIAEVLGGIILGPTAFGRIPGFTEHIFPTDSIPYLTLVANIGLCLFLFLVGLEIDMSVISRNARLSATVALAGMIVPFGAGAGLSAALYKQFIDIPDSGTSEAGGPVKFTHFMLFAGVAFSITAFPVLCRILTELKLLDTTVGVVVLSAGVGNDIIGWILLALSVALVNAGSGLTALYILLICVGWTIFLLVPGKRALLWLARNTGSTNGHGPTIFFMTVTMMTVFGSAFFTDVIGVHAIFGAFVAGIMVPREGGLAIALTEKLEDMVSIIFLPLYFTLSGLSTDLGLLNNGITWGYTIAICALAFTGKFGGCSLAARFLAGFSWRESGTIGALMSCKGLVELIVLNVGLSAGILSRRVFSMFVLEALLLTFMTTPLVTLLYPPDKRVRVSPTGANFNNVAGEDAKIAAVDEKLSFTRTKSREARGDSDVEKDASSRTYDDDDLLNHKKTNITVVLDKIEHLPGMMAITQLLKPSLSTSSHQHKISALRLIELSDRTSAVMKSIHNAHEHDTSSDPLLAIYTMFGALNDLFVKPLLEIVPWEDFAGSVVECATTFGSSWGGRRENAGGEMVLVPWLPPTNHRNATVPSTQPATSPSTPGAALGGYNPFDALFKAAGAGNVGGGTGAEGIGSDRGATSTHAHFVRSIFSRARDGVDVGLYMDLSSSHSSSLGPLGAHHQQRVHILLPFFGGPDDRLALDLVAQLCENERVEATCLRVVKCEVDATPLVGDVPQAHLRERDEKDGLPLDQEINSPTPQGLTVTSVLSARSTTNHGFPDTVYGHANTAMRMQSETADNLWWGRYKDHPSRGGDASTNSDSTPPHASASSSSFPTTSALSRMHFKDLASPTPLHAIIAEANRITSLSTSTSEKSSSTSRTTTKVLVVAGRSRRMAVESHVKELKGLVEEYSGVAAAATGTGVYLGSEVKKTVGDVASAMILAGCAEGIIAVQAKSGEI